MDVIYQNPIATYPEIPLKSTQPSSDHSPQPPPKGCSGRRGWAGAGAGPITTGSTTAGVTPLRCPRSCLSNPNARLPWRQWDTIRPRGSDGLETQAFSSQGVIPGTKVPCTALSLPCCVPLTPWWALTQRGHPAPCHLPARDVIPLLRARVGEFTCPRKGIPAVSHCLQESKGPKGPCEGGGHGEQLAMGSAPACRRAPGAVLRWRSKLKQ